MTESRPPQSDGFAGTRTILYLCFLLSGCAGLVYEVLWAKYLALYLGSTGLAHIIVLATFMGGLALGSHVWGRITDRAASPLKLYVYLEFAIGAYALVFEPIFEIGRSLFLNIVNATQMTPGGLIGARLIGCILPILIPTFLMGGTLPALARHMLQRDSRIGREISRLYFINSLGAVFGCILAGFFLIRALGLQSSMMVGAILNIAGGLTAMMMLKRDTRTPQEALPDEDDSGRQVADPPRNVVVILLACAGLSGAVSMMYEVAWIRLLTLVLGSSTYSFSLMLATFILGLSLGSYILSLRRKNSGFTMIFGLSEIAVGALVLLTLPFYIRLPYIFNHVASSLDRSVETFGLYQAAKFVMCAGVMLIPTILQGITLPAATKVLLPHTRKVGKRVGLVLAINTMGTMLGAIFAGAVGLPWLGIKGTLELAVALNGILGLAVLATVRRPAQRRTGLIAAAVVCAIVWSGYLATMGPWNRQVFSAGLYRTRQRIPTFEELLQRVGERTTIFYRDGIDATIAVQDTPGPPAERLLVINGKVDASSVGDLVTQKAMAHLPVLMHPQPRRVLIIGVGSGATIGSVLTYDVEQVDVVEISADVIEASRHFDGINRRYWEDPRVRVFQEDAKTFLQANRETYDVIISEPTNPWIAGVAGVFSREFFQACRERMDERGIFLQWFHAYEVEDAVAYLIVETCTETFPSYTLWNPSASDLFIIASPAPYRAKMETMLDRIRKPEVSNDFADMGMPGLFPLLLTQMANHADTGKHIQWLGAVNSDYFPILEYVAPRGFYIGTKADGTRRLDQRSNPAYPPNLAIDDLMRIAPPTNEDWTAAYAFARKYGSIFTGFSHAIARRWSSEYPDNSDARLAIIRETPDDRSGALESAASFESDIPYPDAKLHCRILYETYEARKSWLHTPDTSRLLERIDSLLSNDSRGPDPELLMWHGGLMHDARRFDDAIASYTAAIQAQPLDSSLRVECAMRLCESTLAAGEAATTREVFLQFLEPHAGKLEVRLLQARIIHALTSGRP